VEEHSRGALGSSAEITITADDETALALARATPELVEGTIWREENAKGVRSLDRGAWWTWRHQVGHESARDMASPHKPTLIFDWTLLQATTNREEYEAAVRAKHGRVYL
jgi:hypothetical protein